MQVSTQSCPECSGAVNVEHVANEDLFSHELTLLYCEFCGLGIETLWKKSGRGVERCFSLEHRARVDPVDLGMFLQRLQNASVA